MKIWLVVIKLNLLYIHFLEERITLWWYVRTKTIQVKGKYICQAERFDVESKPIGGLCREI